MAATAEFYGRVAGWGCLIKINDFLGLFVIIGGV